MMLNYGADNLLKYFFKIIVLFNLLFFSIGVEAEAFEKINYEKLQQSDKIANLQGVWRDKVADNSNNYFVKLFNESDNQTLFYSHIDEFSFATHCDYEFIYKGSLIGYSNSMLKFYEFILKDFELFKRELSEDELSEMFPDRMLVKLSDFDTKTNSLKIKNKNKNLKIILLNDSDKNFNDYVFTTNNSVIKHYELKGFVDIYKKGMLHFAKKGENKNWYVLLIR